MWEVMICDSDKNFVSKLNAYVQDFYSERGLETNIQGYTDGTALLDAVAGQKVDLLFLNTRLSDMHGFVLAGKIRSQSDKKDTSLVFLSDHDEDVFDSFMYRPFGYMRKTQTKNDLDRIMHRLWNVKHADRSITVRHQRTQKLLRIPDIMYMESQGHYLSIHCADGEVYRFRGRMAEYEELLQGSFFVHSAKSYLVNCVFIAEVKEQVRLTDNTMLPCSKTRKNEVKKMCDVYLKDLAEQR